MTLAEFRADLAGIPPMIADPPDRVDHDIWRCLACPDRRIFTDLDDAIDHLRYVHLEGTAA